MTCSLEQEGVATYINTYKFEKENAAKLKQIEATLRGTKVLATFGKKLILHRKKLPFQAAFSTERGT